MPNTTIHQRYWLGILQERNGTGSLVLYRHPKPDRSLGIFDPYNAPQDTKYVSLYHFGKMRYIQYKRDTIRPRLTTVYIAPGTDVTTILRIFSKPRQKRPALTPDVASQLREYAMLAGTGDDGDDDYIDPTTQDDDQHVQEVNVELQQELWDDSDNYARSEEDGWLYPDREGPPEDNLIDPRYEDR